MTRQTDKAPFGIRLVQRLRRYDLELRSPSPQGAEGAHLREISRFRCDVYREFGSFPGHSGPALTEDDAIDRTAWHITARFEGRLVGCLRCIVFNYPLRAEVPERVLRNSLCQLAPADRQRCLSSIRAFLVSRHPADSPLAQFGGLAVSGRRRGTAVATGLCLAATAFTRALGSGGGLLLAADKSRTEKLYLQAGGFRLSIDGGPVPPLYDAFHCDRVVVMGSAPFGNDARLEPTVEYLRNCLFTEHCIGEVACA